MQIRQSILSLLAAAASAGAGQDAVLDFLGPEHDETPAYTVIEDADGTPVVLAAVGGCSHDNPAMRKHYLRYKAGQESIRDFPYLAELADFFECDGDVPEEVFRELIAAGAEVDAVDCNGLTALQKMVDHGSLVELMIRAGADVNRPYPADEWGFRKTCLHVVVERLSGTEAAECCRLLVEAGADINAVTRGETPLDRAVATWRSGKREILPAVFYLMNHGAKLAQEPPLPPIYHEMAKGNVEGVKRLLAQRPLRELEADAQAALLIGDAAYIGNVEICAALLATGAEVNMVYHDQKTPLHIAAGEGNLELCRLLLRSGAAVNAQEYSRTALDIVEYWAPEETRAALIHLLRAAGGKRHSEMQPESP